MLGVSSAAVPASLRRTNQRTVLSLLLRLGRASRADLAKAAGLSQPTAGKIIGELLQRGMLQIADAPDPETGDTQPARLGRPGQLLTLEVGTPRFIGIELGVSQTRVSALPIGVKLMDEWNLSFPTSPSPQQWLEDLRRVARGLPRKGLWGALLSVPGIVDENTGKVLYSPNLHWLEHADLAEMLQRCFRAPAIIVQEIRALALGQLAAEPGAEDFLLVDFDEGVGGAIVLNGKLYSAPMPLSGELGHTPVPGNTRRCGCGGVGCLETLISEHGLLETFSAATGQRRSWELLVKRVATHGLEPWLSETLNSAANVLVGALNVLGVHRLVVTGKVTGLPGCAVEHMLAKVRQGALWARFGEVHCATAPRRRAAGLIAAGLDRLVFPSG